ncbi:MAG: glycosyltransferase [Flavobacteriaceae bacterium]|jgi:glycosyltransferase involved in cell wall biosynthesis|nr:glycosyltransferase [Flavobacteriaceae bacterium]
MKISNDIKIIHLVLSSSRLAGGLYYSVSGITSSLLNYSKNIELFSGYDPLNFQDYNLWDNGIKINFFKKLGPNSFGYMPLLLFKLILSKPDIIHIHGVWGYQALVGSLIKFFLPNVSLVLSPRGMLDDWSLNRSVFKKKIALFFYVKRLLRHVDLIHALNKNEETVIKKNFKNIKKYVVSPNGTMIKKKIKSIEFNKDPKFIYLGRIHPKKGIEFILNAIHILNKQNIKVNLDIAGWGNPKYIDFLKSKIVSLKLLDQVKLVGSKYGHEKETFFRKADAFILPSYSEGLPMAVLEAWSYGVFTFISKHCNFENELKMPFAEEIELNEYKLAESLKKYLLNFDMNKKMTYSDLAFKHIKNHYSWDVLANHIFNEYIKLKK